MAESYNEWADHKQGAHPLLESLLRPGGPLHVYPASYEHLLELADLSESGHRYLMPDHGLFVAGVLHTIAPQAQLHLYEVLNPYGVGSLESVALGFQKVLELLQQLRLGGDPRPLVVNCSLTLGVSVDGEANPDLPEAMKDPALLKHTRIAFEEMVALLDQPDSVVVAAAGNDASLKKEKPSLAPRPKTRYPAAFPSVIGVGALPLNTPEGGPFEVASYSNLADDLPQDGYVTLGGEEGAGRGMRGLFIAAYPKNNSGLDDRDPGIKPDQVGYENNDQGWAFWSGTSFATPVVSGLLASWWSKDLKRVSSGARPFLDSLTEATPSVDGEKVILVQQV
jgi:subtilisin family serine protease